MTVIEAADLETARPPTPTTDTIATPESRDFRLRRRDKNGNDND
jgi:hypothetical protein